MKKVTMPEIKMPVADVNTHEFTLQALSMISNMFDIQASINHGFVKSVNSLNRSNFILTCCLGVTVYLIYEINKDVEELKSEVNELKNH